MKARPWSPGRLAPSVCAAVLALGMACSDGGSSPRQTTPPAPPPPPPPPLGNVTLLANPCPSGVGGLPNATCQVLRIDDPLNAPIQVELRIIEPAVPLLGTLVFCTGNTGEAFWGDSFEGQPVLKSLLDLGFRIVDRAWSDSWFGSSSSFKDQSRRHAVLLQWVHDNVHTSGVFAAVGNSAGSGEIAYGLSTWGTAGLLDAAILTGGPPMSRLDYACQNPPEEPWASQCAGLVPPDVINCANPLPCSSLPSVPLICATTPPAATPSQLVEQSILHSAASTNYPATIVHCIMGFEDCTFVVPQGVLYMNAVTSPKAMTFVPGAKHWLAETQGGRDAVVQAVVDATNVIVLAGIK